VYVIALAMAAIAAPASALAQQSVDVASISGRVVDPSGAVVAGAQVSARQTTTNVASTAATDRDGRFRFPYLRVGPYEVRVRQPGFQDAIRPLTLTVASAFELPITLTVAGVDARVTVTSSETVLDAARSQIASTVSRAEVEDIPLNGRQFLDLAFLVPAVSPANVAATQLFPETSAVPGATLSVGSQRNLSNNFIVDGLSANDDAAALSGMTYGVDAVDQFQVISSGAQAELGRALGGYVNVVTRSGTNVLHGTAYTFLRDDRFNAANPLSGKTLPMRQGQFGASIGGPVVSGRTFYFGNAEVRRLDQTGLVTISPESVSAINARLTSAGYRGLLLSTGNYSNPVDSTNLLAKIDHTLSDRDQMSMRYSLYDVTSDNSRGAGALSAPSASAGLDNRDQAIAVSNTLTVTPRTVLETRAQVAHGNLDAPPSDLTGPAVAITNIAAFGRLSSSPTGRVNTLSQVVNNLSHQAGAHALKAGVDLLLNKDRITFPRSVRGSYSFSTLTNFLSGAYNLAGFTQTFGDTEVDQSNPNLGVYAQDEWKVTSGLTLNLGVRYDLQWLETIRTDRNNVAPRVGFAWVPWSTRNTIVRGSVGVFYDRVPLRAVANALLSAGNTTELTRLRQIAITLSPAQAGAPVFPAVLEAPVPSVTLPTLTTIDRNLQNAYSRQASVEVEQQIGRQTTVSIGYQYVRGINLLLQVNQNVPTCVAAGTNNGCRPVAGYANNNQYSAAGESNYHGVQISLVQRPGRWGHYRVSYTVSKAMNNLGEFFFSSPIDPADLTKDWGRSDDDQRHRLAVSGTVHTSMEPARTVWEHVSHGFQISGLLQAYSALPLNVTSGVTTIQGTGGRPVVNGATPSPLDVTTATFIPRNAGTGNGFFTVNARVVRAFRLSGRTTIEGLVEGFNLTNRTNALTRNGGFGAGAYPTAPLSTFGQVTAVGEPRSVQFGVRMRF
jgi:hypothetical protein